MLEKHKPKANKTIKKKSPLRFHFPDLKVIVKTERIKKSYLPFKRVHITGREKNRETGREFLNIPCK